MKILGVILLACLLGACAARPEAGLGPVFRPAIPFAPRLAACPRAFSPIRIDGRADEEAWSRAPWTADFVAIEGGPAPAPPLRTRARLLWDDSALYVFAELEEPHLWAQVTRRDDVVYRDPDFEVFIDPDGDSHGYYEIEVNVIGTVWDLRLSRPYLDGGAADDSWDCRGLELAIAARGTINRADDRDEGWSVEMAIPFTALAEGRPEAGDRWRLNFARVEWDFEVVAGSYRRVLDPAVAEWLQPMNWCWSPQGMVNMHRPEMWGIVEFQDEATPPVLRAEDQARWLLRRLYYSARERADGRPTAAEIAALEAPAGWSRPVVSGQGPAFRATLAAPDGRRLEIRHDGRCAWLD